MTEQTEEQVARDKAAIAAMKNAQANMSTALDRIARLELALGRAASALGAAKEYVGPRCYVYEGRKTIHTVIDEAVANAHSVLGA